MPPPNYTQDFPLGIELIRHHNGRYEPSPALINLLVTARNGYDWPAGTGANVSQQTILNLKASVALRVGALNANAAHAIVSDVSEWAGNNANSHAEILGATNTQKLAMQNAISDLCVACQETRGLDTLCNLPGISLVIASKIYRFCAPLVGAAVDRHASYFFNSLPVVNGEKASHFVREWSNGRHTSSRLAIYSPSNYIRNREEYVERYLSLLAKIAKELNALPVHYNCAATNQRRSWVPADVEMAAYFWWACNGSR